VIRIDDIENFLIQYGWNFERISDEVITTGFSSEEIDETFLIVIQYSLPWLRLSIPAFIIAPEDEKWLNFSKQLLLLNHDARQVYFSMDSDGNIVLSTDLYLDNNFSYDIFEMSISALSYLAEAAYVPLYAVANSES
jgi:hypothetical protein